MPSHDACTVDRAPTLHIILNPGVVQPVVGYGGSAALARFVRRGVVRTVALTGEPDASSPQSPGAPRSLPAERAGSASSSTGPQHSWHERPPAIPGQRRASREPTRNPPE